MAASARMWFNTAGYEFKLLPFCFLFCTNQVFAADSEVHSVLPRMPFYKSFF